MFSGVTFFTEGGHSIGLGHVVRSIALARTLSKYHVSVNFIINNDRSVVAPLKDSGFQYALGCIEGFGSTLEYGSVVVVDTKKDFTPLALFLKSIGKSIVAIDNLKLNGLCDAVIIPSATFDPLRWSEEKGELPARGAGSLYGGCDYVIVAETFLECRAEKRVPTHTPLKILISMGGSDPNELSELLINALLGLGGIEVCTVVGPAAKVSQGMRAVMDSPPENFSFVSGVTNLAPLVMSVDLVFTALGITVYELASIGVPSILIGNYAEDVEEMSKLESMGICKSLGYYKDVTEASVHGLLQFFLHDRDALAAVGARAKELVDGGGAERAAGILSALFYGSTTKERNGMSNA